MNDILSILPPFIAVVVALTTKRVFFSLFAAVWVGGLITTGGDPIGAVVETFNWIKASIVDEWHARFLLIIAMLGSGAAFIHKTGGSIAIVKSLEGIIVGRKSAQAFTYVLGLLVFFNDYVNAAIVGNASRNITAKYKISREKLAYLLDTTAAPVSTLGPVSDWIGYQVSLIAAAFVTLSLLDQSPYIVFLNSIAWNFYCILSLLAVPMIIVFGDFGSMAAAEHRAMTTGALVAEGDSPLSDVEHDLGDPVHSDRASIWSFILPIAVLIAVAMWSMWSTGGGMAAGEKGFIEVVGDSDISIGLVWASFAMTAVGVLMALKAGYNVAECEDILLSGFKTMLPAIVTMILAWSVASVTHTLGTAEYVVSMTESWLTPAMLPFLVFCIGAFIAFATGTSWGTMAILTPIVIPLAYQVGDIALVSVALGGIFSGAVFGDHCSPISDTTVMSSIFAGSDHIAHVKTQIPYALVPAGISCILYLASNVFSSGYVLLLIGAVIQLAAIKFLSVRARKKGMPERHSVGVHGT